MFKISSFTHFLHVLFLFLTKTTPKVNDGVKRVAYHPRQVKEHKKLVQKMGPLLLASCSIKGKSCHMYLKKEKKCSKIIQNVKF